MSVSWHKQDQILLSWLRSSLSKTILAQVVSSKTSSDLWHNLQSSFSATSRARLSDLRRQLQNTTKGGSSCAEYIQKLQSIADELAFIGTPVSDEDLVMHLLQGLGPEYDLFVVAVTTADRHSIIDLQALLLPHESLINSHHSSSSSNSLPSASNPAAFYSNTRPPHPRPRPPNRPPYRPPFQARPSSSQPPLLPSPFQQRPISAPRPSSFTSPTYRPPAPSTRPPNPDRATICQICSKRGHSAKVCWYRFDSVFDDNTQPPYQAYVAQPSTITTATE